MSIGYIAEFEAHNLRERFQGKPKELIQAKLNELMSNYEQVCSEHVKYSVLTDISVASAHRVYEGLREIIRSQINALQSLLGQETK
jgi:hypothetical protein